ncbi:MAG: hypothetical protein C0605_08495 [Hyphomicrobiales bacterium]|nr:MAG: hypothetical protein C0605_08495 [Hyphomicrobiales bacterium]
MGEDDKSPPPKRDKQASFEARLDALDDRLDRLDTQKQAPQPDAKRGTAIGIAFRLVTELVAGLAVGAFLGYWIDRILGTTPVFLLIFFILGAAAGILNVFRAARQMQTGMGEDVDKAKRS